jgi:magnesium transporter
MTHLLFGPEVHELLESGDRAAMAEFCESLHPATAAEALEGEVAVEQAWEFLGSTNIVTQAEIFSYFSPEWQEEMVAGVGRPHMARLIEQMAADDRADLLRRLPPKVTESILRLVDEADRRDIATLVKYPEGTAGALMTTDYAWLSANITIEDALERLRLQAPDKETIYTIYIVDDQRRLVGVLSLRDLILSSRRATVTDIMETNVIAARVNDDREHVADLIRRYDLLSLPVIDGDGRLVGIVTADDAIDVVVEEANEDAYRMGAVAPLEESYLEAPFLLLWRKRAAWLSVLFIAELFTFTALSFFEDAIAEVVVLSLFVPLCISTGGNSGSQAATLITRAMALGQVRLIDWLRVFRHEIAMGVVLGLTLGVIGFVRASITPHDVRSSSPPRYEGFTVTVDTPLKTRVEERPPLLGFLGRKQTVVMVELPAGVLQVIKTEHPVEVALPEDEALPPPSVGADGRLEYSFPRKCSIPRPPVDRWRLALVIGLAVAGICLWGTIVGSMLPLIFRRLGYDPGVASSPFVATFVDVTGIIFYFLIARAVLWDVLK